MNCAIGGDDTYHLLPYLFEHNELESAASDKVFLGFSDTTMVHLRASKTKSAMAQREDERL
ncbi:LD-carboxypeptidase [Atopobium sp. oral taxon 810]|uniref:LD-carboxypeptidase n=1 Tax=Atopobium sp. oral taxon 810 TaxID=712158 RepID=UPI000396F133|nr:hypothetical protein HMPREF9069_01274 [Atopobium sp. oral taxon 810 str. F0209]